ncbi:MAG: DNA polymerase III subunit gamma/tau [Phycisphaeraceae bacterium]|nr:DNA polymerase III subunit gamma/tau [Phycisphaerales bacterium]MCB9859646.1 DNA polymerase III subunit gamma/tau [Phycisphaeraceae bacterium]
MAYTVLARRYRSRDFAELVGQEPIARTLQAAIDQDRVAHAYLFCGTRGVGKTSLARIFAKALAGGSDEVNAAIMGGTDTDVIEIDGASNNKVEEARDLIANSIYTPLRGGKKIYIIDEVHMLTTQAFNALLKTMEEPPAHVVFILCTTEPQKVPPTIQSRCQRFDFRNIPIASIADHLMNVIEQEGKTAEPELVHSVAKLGNGSMRDALSLLDRVMAAGQTNLTQQMLDELLGLPERELVTGVLQACAEGSAAGALERANDMLSRGTSFEQVLDSILERVRDLMVIRACGDNTKLVEISDSAREDEAKLAANFSVAGLTHMIALTESMQRAIKSSSCPRALFDACVVRLAMTEHFADATAVALGRAEVNVRPMSRSAPAGKA